MIEGLVHTVDLVIFHVDVVAGSDDIVLALSHQRDNVAPANVRSTYADPTIWLSQNAGDNSGTWAWDLRGLGMELAGPQAWLVFNGSGATRQFGMSMWYRSRRVGLIEWANLAHVTSFEEI